MNVAVNNSLEYFRQGKEDSNRTVICNVRIGTFLWMGTTVANFQAEGYCAVEIIKLKSRLSKWYS